MGDSEEVVMMAAKRDGRSVMRLERMFRSEIDDKLLLHVAGGPHKGILIAKAVDNLKDVEPAEGRLEFLAYLVNEEQHNQSVQDYWTLRFWFRGQAEGVVKKKTFTDYFQELMNPSSFPKNYIGFIKKALVLLKVYHVIKRVELEVQETEDPSPEESIPPIKSFTSVFTPASYTYQLVPEVQINNKTFITFMVKAAADAHVALRAVYGDVDRKTYEIVIGTDGNTKSIIRYGAGGPIMVESMTMNILSEEEFRYFWVNWANNKIEVGRGANYGVGAFLQWTIPPSKQFNINCLAVSTGTPSRGQWEFAELLDAEKDFGKEAKKKRIKHSLLWIAKKQKMLQCLEDAYPNMVKTAEMFKYCKIKQSDTMVALVFLSDMQKKNLIKEVEGGYWMRLQKSQESEIIKHEVKIVKHMPELKASEQPTIAIVTSLFCEKVAVDAMIEEKTTYVKYKTEGESQVYTLGRIGKFKVVSTKVSRKSSSEQEARICAENTITRLLGSFSKIHHVLIVGVGSGVPHYSDGNQHVRLGDVVVSVPSRKNGAIYMYCDKIEKMTDANGYNYSTREWDCSDNSLQDVAVSLKQIMERDTNPQRPWDRYMNDAKDILQTEESNFHRPPMKTDRLFYTDDNGTDLELEHPAAGKGYRVGQSNCRLGVIASGKLVSRSPRLRQSFAEINGIRAYDSDVTAVLESLEGNRNNSFIIIRGISDYSSGSRKEWQPYASLAAAAYMKSLIYALK